MSIDQALPTALSLSSTINITYISTTAEALAPNMSYQPDFLQINSFLRLS
jgi:hypothetical protein